MQVKPVKLRKVTRDSASTKINLLKGVSQYEGNGIFKVKIKDSIYLIANLKEAYYATDIIYSTPDNTHHKKTYMKRRLKNYLPSYYDTIVYLFWSPITNRMIVYGEIINNEFYIRRFKNIIVKKDNWKEHYKDATLDK